MSERERILLRPDEAATALGIGRSVLFEMQRDGRIESITIGKSRRVPVDALRVFVERQREAQQAELAGVR